MIFKPTMQPDSLLTLFTYGRPPNELKQRLWTANADDFIIYTIKENNVARLVTPGHANELRIVLDASRGELNERILLQGNALELMKKVASGERDVRLNPLQSFYGPILEKLGAPRVVFFFAPTANFSPPLGIKINNYVSANSKIKTTATSVMCVIDFTADGQRVIEGVLNIIGIRLRLPFVCAFCGIMSLERLRKCGGCRAAFYCSKECQKQHWTAEHKAYCGADCFILIPPNTTGEVLESYPHVEEFEERARAFALRRV